MYVVLYSVLFSQIWQLGNRVSFHLLKALLVAGLDYMFLHLKMMNYSQNNVFESSIQLLCKFGTEKLIMFSD